MELNKKDVYSKTWVVSQVYLLDQIDGKAFFLPEDQLYSKVEGSITEIFEKINEHIFEIIHE